MRPYPIEPATVTENYGGSLDRATDDYTYVASSLGLVSRRRRAARRRPTATTPTTPTTPTTTSPRRSSAAKATGPADDDPLLLRRARPATRRDTDPKLYRVDRRTITDGRQGRQRTDTSRMSRPSTSVDAIRPAHPRDALQLHRGRHAARFARDRAGYDVLHDNGGTVRSEIVNYVNGHGHQPGRRHHPERDDRTPGPT